MIWENQFLSYISIIDVCIEIRKYGDPSSNIEFRMIVTMIISARDFDVKKSEEMLRKVSENVLGDALQRTNFWSNDVADAGMAP